MFAKFKWNFPRLLNPKPIKTRKISRTRKVATKSSDLKLKQIWESLCAEFFPTHDYLLKYSIDWSSRAQKRTLASCNLHSQKIIVARELNYLEYEHWLPPLIYHEMCHAVLGFNVKKNRSRRSWHGKEFKQLEKQHPQMAAFEAWTKSGGWITAVRSDRGKRAAQKRFSTNNLAKGKSAY